MFGKFVRFDCRSSCGVLSGYCVFHPNEVLTTSEKNVIFNLLYPVALSAFGQKDGVSFQEDVYRHLFAGDGLILVMSREDAVAFRMWNIFACEDIGSILYLAGMCVRKDYQGGGIGSSLLHYILDKSDECAYVVLRTQSPVMKKCFDQAIGVVSFPNNDRAPMSVCDAGSFVAKRLGDSSYDRDSFISIGVYGGSLYDNVPCVTDELYKKQFMGLNQARGDAMLCIWQRK